MFQKRFWKKAYQNKQRFILRGNTFFAILVALYVKITE
jgi:hypothetical protein